MTGREFLNGVANGDVDELELLLRILEETGSLRCPSMPSGAWLEVSK
jgi:hypothetical protein